MILEGGFWGKKERFFVSFSRRAQNHKEKKKKRKGEKRERRTPM